MDIFKVICLKCGLEKLISDDGQENYKKKYDDIEIFTTVDEDACLRCKCGNEIALY